MLQFLIAASLLSGVPQHIDFGPELLLVGTDNGTVISWTVTRYRSRDQCIMAKAVLGQFLMQARIPVAVEAYCTPAPYYA